MEFILVFGIMWIVVAAIYFTLFAVGTGLGAHDEIAVEQATPEPEAHMAVHQIPHAA